MAAWENEHEAFLGNKGLLQGEPLQSSPEIRELTDLDVIEALEAYGPA